MASNRKKILITGASGLIGREFCNQLSLDNDVTAVDNNQRFKDYVPNNCLYVQANLTEYLAQATNDFDIIYHMAATNGTKYFYSQPNDVLRNNVTLDLAMFRFAESNPACKLIYASSSEVVAGTTIFLHLKLRTLVLVTYTILVGVICYQKYWQKTICLTVTLIF